jgi:lipopolysaccharide/colanic/teichoic acid biosynthesis glycosyltransferase
MSAAVISHLENVRPRSRPRLHGGNIYSGFWPAILLSADVVALAVAAVLARPWTGNVWEGPMSALAIVLSLFCASGLYQARAGDPATGLGGLFRSICLAGFVLACMAAESSERPSMLSGILWLAFATPILVTLRSILRSFLIRSGQGLTPALIIGSGARANRLRELLTKHKHLGLRPVAILDDRQAGAECDAAILAGGGLVWNLDTATALQISRQVVARWGSLTKRIVDIGLALVLAIFLSPLLLAISLRIWLSSSGPILFRQTRIGRDGKAFQICKFRSMVVDTEGVLKSHLAANAEAKREWELTQKLRHDPRVLPIGRWLRRSSCDELPQLWNVICGDMSLVGPRPVVREEIARYGCAAELYESVRPGMTGLWQVSGRSNTSYEERVSLDEYYVENRSAWLDLHILIRTAGTLLLGEGAY